MKNAFLLLAIGVFFAILALPALSILANAANQRPAREIQMQVVGLGLSKHGLVLKAYSPVCFNDLSYSGRYAECATEVYSFRMPAHVSLEYNVREKTEELQIDKNEVDEATAKRILNECREYYKRKILIGSYLTYQNNR